MLRCACNHEARYAVFSEGRFLYVCEDCFWSRWRPQRLAGGHQVTSDFCQDTHRLGLQALEQARTLSRRVD